MQDHSSFDARHNMGSNPENRFCRLSVYCASVSTKIQIKFMRIHGDQRGSMRSRGSVFSPLARPHVAKSTREKLLKFGWITIPHSPYSPELAPMNYRLYGSLSEYLREKKFDDENHLKMDLVKLFGQKCRYFYEGGILSFLERWRRVVDSNGAYIVES